MYYLNARYYDPEIGRFISQDSIEYLDPETLNGLNLFAYCGNNPVMNVDPTGTFVSTILGGIFGAIWGGITSALKGKNVWKGMLVGAATGALAGLAVDVGIATGGVGGLAIANQMIVDGRTWDEVNKRQALLVGTVTAITNVLGYGISYAASGLGQIMPKGMSIIQKLVASLNPVYTPLGSWIGQAVLGFGIGALPSLIGFGKDSGIKHAFAI